MSKNGLGSLRVMVIDVEGDKILRDELCDAVVAGIACNPEEGKKQEGGDILVACKCGLSTGVAAVAAAEEAIQKQKNKTVESFLRKGGIENVANLMKSALEGDFGGEDSSDEC